MAIKGPLRFGSAGYGQPEQQQSIEQIVGQYLSQFFQQPQSGMESLGYQAPSPNFPAGATLGQLPLIEGVKGVAPESISGQLATGGQVASSTPRGSSISSFMNPGSPSSPGMPSAPLASSVGGGFTGSPAPLAGLSGADAGGSSGGGASVDVGEAAGAVRKAVNFAAGLLAPPTHARSPEVEAAFQAYRAGERLATGALGPTPTPTVDITGRVNPEYLQATVPNVGGLPANWPKAPTPTVDITGRINPDYLRTTVPNTGGLPPNWPAAPLAAPLGTTAAEAVELASQGAGGIPMIGGAAGTAASGGGVNPNVASAIGTAGTIAQLGGAVLGALDPDNPLNQVASMVGNYAGQVGSILPAVSAQAAGAAAPAGAALSAGMAIPMSFFAPGIGHLMEKLFDDRTSGQKGLEHSANLMAYLTDVMNAKAGDHPLLHQDQIDMMETLLTTSRFGDAEIDVANQLREYWKNLRPAVEGRLTELQRDFTYGPGDYEGAGDIYRRRADLSYLAAADRKRIEDINAAIAANALF